MYSQSKINCTKYSSKCDLLAIPSKLEYNHLSQKFFELYDYSVPLFVFYRDHKKIKSLSSNSPLLYLTTGVHLNIINLSFSSDGLLPKLRNW